MDDYQSLPSYGFSPVFAGTRDFKTRGLLCDRPIVSKGASNTLLRRLIAFAGDSGQWSIYDLGPEGRRESVDQGTLSASFGRAIGSTNALRIELVLLRGVPGSIYLGQSENRL